MLGLKILPLILLISPFGYAEQRSRSSEVTSVVSEVSQERIAAIEQKLGNFETRNIFSTVDDPARGIGAAREWIASEFRSYSPRLQVSFDKHRIAKQVPRMPGNVEIWNVVAVLPGTGEPDRQVMVTAHYDSISIVWKKGADGKQAIDGEATAREPLAPGVTDDGSGTAAVMELARVMSRHRFRKTLVFIAFAGEEYGLFGSAAYAEAAAGRHDQIEAVFNNDIIGSITSGNGRTENDRVNVYSEDPNDSASRQAARYFRRVAERYEPGFTVNLIFRHDRFARGGDHSPFNAYGFAAVRVTTPDENFSHQHNPTDTFANTDLAYATRVARANAAAAASLALAPDTPELITPLGRGTMPDGTSGYDAELAWNDNDRDPDLLGYAVVWRSTTAADWEHELFVGKANRYVLKDVNIDEVVLGVKSIDMNGNESLVSAYTTPVYRQSKVVIY